MVAILKHVGTADLDRERLNMSVNTPGSWSADALMRLGMQSGPAALRGLTRLTFSHVPTNGCDPSTVVPAVYDQTGLIRKLM